LTAELVGGALDELVGGDGEGETFLGDIERVPDGLEAGFVRSG
jgi:hypothetical protein